MKKIKSLASSAKSKEQMLSGKSVTREVLFSDFAAYVKSRSLRGTAGALIRGGMCSPAPFGYAKVDTSHVWQGAEWEVCEEQANVVREIFEKRAAGMSLFVIASELNARNIPLPRNPRKVSVGLWRASTVHRLLRNTIYRGVYTFKTSVVSQREIGLDIVTKSAAEYPHPELRLVSDEAWFAANFKKR